MGDDITQWLEELGLGQYAQAFAENGIDLETLPHRREATVPLIGELVYSGAAVRFPSRKK